MGKGYYTITRITDDGPFLTKIILPVDLPVNTEEVDKDTFSVYVERLDDKGNVLMLPTRNSFLNGTGEKEPSKGYLPVRKAYPSDLEGNEVEQGEYVTLEPAFGPHLPISSAMTAINHFNRFLPTTHIITQLKSMGSVTGLVYDKKLKDRKPDLEQWMLGKSSYQLPLNYGYYVPQTEGKKKPLIIWLHGAGEGGTDTAITYSANKVVNLASEKIQGFFGGAYILCPQAPTYWMDGGNGRISTDMKCMYVKALKACIDEFISKNPTIDKKRIYIGGDSNGGYMTLRMIIAYPNFFAAAFPVCEALEDKYISDEKINSICQIPIWFTAAQNDPVVKVDQFSTPTYQRLIAAGAKNVHYSLWDKVVDSAGAFEKVNGKPHEYLGHFSWVYVLNDVCTKDFDGKPVKVDGKKVTLMQWLSLQSK